MLKDLAEAKADDHLNQDAPPSPTDVYGKYVARGKYSSPFWLRAYLR